ncbi:hypothetical protein [Arthrobacter sp. TMN-50]
MKRLLPIAVVLAVIFGGVLILDRGFEGLLIALAAGFVASLGFLLDSSARKKRADETETHVEHKSGNGAGHKSKGEGS